MSQINFITQMDFDEKEHYFVHKYSLFINEHKHIKTTMANIDIQHINIPEIKNIQYYVDGFKKSLEECGQISPVGLKRADDNPSRYDILFGRKRVYAMYYRGLRTVSAVVFETDITAFYDLIKIDEELVRVEVPALKRACLLNKRKSIYNKIFTEEQEKIKNGEIISLNKCFEPFSKFMSEKLQKSQRSIQQDLQIAENITKENIKTIEGTFLENKKNMLLEIARIENGGIQTEIINKILNHEAGTVKEALLKVIPDLKINHSTISKKEELQKNIKELALKLKNRNKEIASLREENDKLRALNQKLQDKIDSFNFFKL